MYILREVKKIVKKKSNKKMEKVLKKEASCDNKSYLLAKFFCHSFFQRKSCLFILLLIFANKKTQELDFELPTCKKSCVSHFVLIRDSYAATFRLKRVSFKNSKKCHNDMFLLFFSANFVNCQWKKRVKYADAHF
jgi:hypothetical protein